MYSFFLLFDVLTTTFSLSHFLRMYSICQTFNKFNVSMKRVLPYNILYKYIDMCIIMYVEEICSFANKNLNLFSFSASIIAWDTKKGNGKCLEKK